MKKSWNHEADLRVYTGENLVVYAVMIEELPNGVNLLHTENEWKACDPPSYEQRNGRFYCNGERINAELS